MTPKSLTVADLPEQPAAAERDTELAEVRRQIKLLRAEMRRLGIRRSSFMNGGHSDQSYRYNARMFEYETRVRVLTGLKVEG